MHQPGGNIPPGHIALGEGKLTGPFSMLNGLGTLAMDGTLACLGAGPREEVGAPGGIASTPQMNTRGERLRSAASSAELPLAGRSAARQARMLEAVALGSSLGRTFQPDRSKPEGDTLAFEGVIMPNFLSVTDEGRAERVGFQSGEPDIALQRQ